MSSIIRIGFSGTRHGMTKYQVQAVYRHLSYVLVTNNWDDPLIEGHHGDCLGGDVQFHTLVTALGGRTVAHPPVNPRFRAWCKADEIREPKPYLPRDWDIAEETGELVAAPEDFEPRRGSGTWTTTGYAVRLGRPARVYLPDGTGRHGSTFYGAPLPALGKKAS